MASSAASCSRGVDLHTVNVNHLQHKVKGQVLINSASKHDQVNCCEQVVANVQFCLHHALALRFRSNFKQTSQGDNE